MSGFLGYLLVGFLAAVVAAIVTRVERRGCLTTVLTGVAGSIIGGYLFDRTGVASPGSFATALLGAVVLLLALRMLGLAKKR